MQSARQAELREKEKERERARAEAAGRRQERAGRRRVEDDASDETPRPANSARTSPPPSSQPGSPGASQRPEKGSLKKGFGKKSKKLGNNQYTKNKEAVASSPHGRKRNGVATSSGEDNGANGDNQRLPNGKASPERTAGPKGKFGRGKHKGLNGHVAKNEEPAELTIPNMKRRMELMAAFITRAQMEMAGGDRTPSSNGNLGSSGNLAGGAVQPAKSTEGTDDAATADSNKFEELSAMEMADVVSRSINGWHQRFDHLA